MFVSRMSDDKAALIDKALSLLLSLNSFDEWSWEQDDNPYGMILNAIKAMIRYEYGPEFTNKVLEAWHETQKSFRWCEDNAASRLIELALDR